MRAPRRRQAAHCWHRPGPVGAWGRPATFRNGLGCTEAGRAGCAREAAVSAVALRDEVRAAAALAQSAAAAAEAAAAFLFSAALLLPPSSIPLNPLCKRSKCLARRGAASRGACSDKYSVQHGQAIGSKFLNGVATGPSWLRVLQHLFQRQRPPLCPLGSARARDSDMRSAPGSRGGSLRALPWHAPCTSGRSAKHKISECVMRRGSQAGV